MTKLLKWLMAATLAAVLALANVGRVPATAAPALAPALAPAVQVQAAPAPFEAAEQVRVAGRAFNLLRDQYVQPLNQAELLQAAWSRLVQEAQAAGAPLPEDRPELGDGPTVDPALFNAAFERYLQLPAEWPDGFLPGYAAIRGMVAYVDEPHTYFLTPRQYADFRARQSGQQQYAGIGVRGLPVDDGLLALEVFEGAPAEAAGMRAGDVIVAAGGVDLAGVTPGERAAQIQGPEGSEVELRVRRGMDSVELTLTVQRAQVTVPLFSQQTLEGNVGYLRLRTFPGRQRMVEVVQAIDTQVAGGATAMILDLRGNPGGAVDGLEYLLDRVIPAGTPLFILRGRSSEPRPRFANSGQGEKGFGVPLVVLVDGSSASASEIFAATVQEQGVATVVGSRTAGAVAEGRPFPLGDGSALNVTVQDVVTTNEAVLNRVGLVPGEEIETTPQLLARGQDPALARALDLARPTVLADAA